jgi:hypothetical protein
MRRDLQPRPGDELAVELRIVTGRRTDLVADRTGTINRLRAQLTQYFPALERAFDYRNTKAALILLTGYQTSDALRRAGAGRLVTWLRKHKARNADTVAAAALEAARASAHHRPRTTVGGRDGGPAGQGGAGPRHRDRRDRDDDRGAISLPPLRRDHPEHARLRHHPRRRVSGRRRRRY